MASEAAPTDWKARCDAFVERHCGPLRTYEGGSSRASRHQGTANELHALVLDARREALEKCAMLAQSHVHSHNGLQIAAEIRALRAGAKENGNG